MKKILALTAALFLAGCNYFSGSGTTDPLPDVEQESTIKQIQEYATKICSFLPTYDSVLQIISAANPTVSGALNIAKAICDVVATKPGAALMSDCPRVNGVCVEGSHIRKAQSLMSDYYTKETCPKVNGVCVDGQKVNGKADTEK